MLIKEWGRLTALSLLASRFLGFILLGLLYRLSRRPLALLVRAGRRRRRRLGNGRLGRLSLALALAGRLRLGGLGDGFLDGLRDGGTLLQLLGDGILVIANVGIDPTNVRHRDAELLAVPDSLLVGHVLGIGVASLVGVNTSIVQAQVVLVCLVPALMCGVSDGLKEKRWAGE